MYKRGEGEGGKALKNIKNVEGVCIGFLLINQ